VTNIEQILMQMGHSEESRRSLALKLARLEHLEAACERYHRRLPHQVQTALRRDAQEYDIDAPAEGMPSLFHQGRSA
jgi:hypothetical protein